MTDFWDDAWNNERLAHGSDLISHLMHRSALRYSYELLGDITGKKILEIGCGSGAQTLDFCRMGSDVTAIDVSEESVKTTISLIHHHHLSAHVLAADAESLPFNDETFDAVYINCMLMHTDKDKVIRESLRVLKKNGSFVMKEVLKHWIFSFPYRTFSPYSATKPHYITLRDVTQLHGEHREFYLFSTFFLFLFYAFKNKQRVHSFFSLFEHFDDIIFRCLSFTRHCAWVTVARVRK